MGELARLRDARDLRISRGHVAAATAGAVLLVVTAFGFGWVQGRARAVPASGGVATSFTAEVPDDAMLELLARVESSGARQNGVDSLTFPDALKGGEGGVPGVPHGPDQPGDPVVIPAGGEVAPVADTVPAGVYTVTVTRTGDAAAAERLKGRLAAAGLEAWVGAELVNGGPSYRVAVGGFVSEKEATTALEAMGAVGGGLAPVVEPIAP